MNEMLEKQFTNFYREHADALFRYCFFRISDRERAKDMTHDIFARMWEYLVKGNTIHDMRSFAYQTARNLLIDEYRKVKHESLDKLIEEGFDFPSDETIQKNLSGEEVLRMIRIIPHSYREVVFLRYVEDISVKEIARVLGESEGNVSVKIHRGLEALKKVLKYES